MQVAPIVESCPARAALAGNPSDGYGGAVVSVPVRAATATVTLTGSPRFQICHSPTSDDSFDAWSDLDRHLDRFGFTGARDLVLASMHRFARHSGTDPAPCAIDVASTIPRSVGLAGSSAIVIATLRCLYRWNDRPPPDPDELASLALAVEVDELGYSAGLQDRVVQAHGRPMFMQFGEQHQRRVGGLSAGSYSALDRPLPGSLFAAFREIDAEPSQTVHGDLRRRFDSGDRRARSAMVELAGLAAVAAHAIDAGDASSLGAAIDGSFDIRRSMIDLRPSQVEMIDVARSAGAHANFAGSGGAIVVFTPEAGIAAAALAALAALGCGIHPIT